MGYGFTQRVIGYRLSVKQSRHPTPCCLILISGLTTITMNKHKRMLQSILLILNFSFFLLHLHWWPRHGALTVGGGEFAVFEQAFQTLQHGFDFAWIQQCAECLCQRLVGIKRSLKLLEVG